jgi:prepilin-type N-terminal cleavage/methylation domain-containing protein
VREARGFTLIEVLIAIFMGLVLMGAAYVTMTSGQKSAAGVERKVAAQQDVRSALQMMALDLSMASYNPNYASGMWHDLPAFGNLLQCTAAASQGPKGIREATPTAITIEMDLNSNNTAGDAGEIVRYDYLNQSITRESPVCLSTRNAAMVSAFLGNSLGPSSVRVINDVLNITNGNNQVAIFRYYDGVANGAELYPDANPADIPNIRRIDVCLAVETQEVDPSTQQPRSLIYSTSVLVRNHALGL